MAGTMLDGLKMASIDKMRLTSHAGGGGEGVEGSGWVKHLTPFALRFRSACAIHDIFACGARTWILLYGFILFFPSSLLSSTVFLALLPPPTLLSHVHVDPTNFNAAVMAALPVNTN